MNFFIIWGDYDGRCVEKLDARDEVIKRLKELGKESERNSGLCVDKVIYGRELSFDIDTSVRIKLEV